jgi:hypothetical protein
MQWLDEIPLPMLVVGAVLMALAPFHPEPHLIEKLRMLMDGDLRRPLDIFDLFIHSAPLVLVAVRLFRLTATSDSTEGGKG